MYVCMYGTDYLVVCRLCCPGFARGLVTCLVVDGTKKHVARFRGVGQAKEEEGCAVPPWIVSSSRRVPMWVYEVFPSPSF